MASQEIQDKVKRKLFEEWMPDKPGGLKGLINMAADAAISTVAEMSGASTVDSVSTIEATESAVLIETEIVDDDANAASLLAETIANLPDQEPEFVQQYANARLSDQTKYRCPQCDVTHQRDSAVGTRHAHLFYGGPPQVVHLEHCPVLEDVDVQCNCNAVPASPAARAQARRET